MLQKIKAFFAQGNRAQWCVFALFALSIFIKNILFHWECFHSILISSIWHAPYEFFAFWCPKIAVALFMASFVFVSKRPWWTILFSLVFDTWILANLIYFRSNAAFLDVFALSMAGNMDGFWSSVWLYCSWKDGLYYLFTLVYAVILIFIPCFSRRQWIWCGIGVLISYLISLFGIYSMTRRWGEDMGVMFYNPISLSMRTTLSSLSYNDHVKDFTLLHSVGFIMVDEVENIKARTNISKEDIDPEQIRLFVKEDDSKPSFDTPLVLILVESLENWGVNETSTPYLWRYMQTRPCLHATRITKQTRGGTSADGQMLLNTGLLPINQGAACFRFPTNIYPSIGDCCSGQTATILPHEIGVWNQQYMSTAYAYDTTFIRNENDSLLFQTTIDCLHSGYQMVQTITMSSHSPFHYGASRSALELPKEMPNYMSDYLKSLHYMDAGLQVLLSQIESDSILSKATIFITGDHTIFPDDLRQEYANWCQQNNQNYSIEEAFVPLIVFSPNIQKDVLVTDTCYQMDMFPTIVSLICCEDYYWKGFGVNIMDSIARHNRPILEKDAYELSDKIIRSNMFNRGGQIVANRNSDQQYIAHAGGSIDGYIYTNSLEAVQNALDHGITYIELDLEMTSDSQLVASHGWMGCEYWLSDVQPSYAQFMEHKVYERFTPIDMYRIDSLLITNPQLSLVTDKISDPKIINCYFGKYKNRVWVECFTDEDYYELEKLGYHVLRSEYPPTKTAVWAHVLKHFSFRDLKIRNYTFGGIGGDFTNRHGDCLAIFGGANISASDADRQFSNDERIKFVYVDYLDQ